MKKGFTPNYCVNCGYHYNQWEDDQFGMCRECDQKEIARAVKLQSTGTIQSTATDSKFIRLTIPLVRKYGISRMARNAQLSDDSLYTLCNYHKGNPSFRKWRTVMRLTGHEIIVINDQDVKQEFDLENKLDMRIRHLEDLLTKQSLELSIEKI